MNSKYLLVELPKITGTYQKFYAVGFYDGGYFNFAVLTPSNLSRIPLRSLKIPSIDSSDQIRIIDCIQDLPEPPK